MTRRTLDPSELERSKDQNTSVQVSLRLPARLVSRVEDMAGVLQENPPPGATRVSPALVYRLALERGLDALEADAKDRSER